MLIFLGYIYMWCHVVLFIHFWVLDWTTMMFHDTVSTLMYHFTFGMTTWWWYISMLSPYLCSNVFIWCYCCFKCLKFWKTWMYFVFCNVSRLFPIFSPMLPRSCIRDPCRLFQHWSQHYHPLWFVFLEKQWKMRWLESLRRAWASQAWY